MPMVKVGDVHRRLGGRVAQGKAVHVREDVFQLERVRELPQVHLFQEGAHAFHGLPEVGGHRRLAVTDEAVVMDFNLHVRRGGAGIGCHGEGVLQLQFIRLPAELHPLPAIHPVGLRDRAVAAPHGGAGAQQGRPGTGGGRRLEEFASFHTDIKYTKKKSRRQIAGGFG